MVCGLCEYNAFNRRPGNLSTLDKHIGPIIHKGVWPCKLREFPGRNKTGGKIEKPGKNRSVDSYDLN